MSVTEPPAIVIEPRTPRQRRATLARFEGLVWGSASLAVLLVLWEAVWQAGWISPLFFSGPTAIAQRFVEMVGDGSLWRAAVYSGKNFFIGFALAILAGVPLGILLGWYRRLLLIFDPLINGLYAMPRIALYPLVIIWFGIGGGSKIFIVFLSAVLPIVINTLAGVRNIDPDLLKAARAFCARDRQIFVTVAVPSSVPFILTGIRQAIAHGLIGVIIAELFAGSEGIGYMISYSGQMFQTDTLLVCVLCVAAAGMALSTAVEHLQRRFQRWRPAHVGGR